MLDKIDPLAAALRNLEQQHDELNAAFASGKINGSQFENYSRKIQETRRELTGEAQAEREAAKAHDEAMHPARINITPYPAQFFLLVPDTLYPAWLIPLTKVRPQAQPHSVGHGQSWPLLESPSHPDG